MITSKEALLSLYTFVAAQVPKEKIDVWAEYLDAIRKDLDRLDTLEEEVIKNRKILEIIKEKKVDIYVITYKDSAYQYNTKERIQVGHKFLTEAEFNLLKGWLNNDNK